MPDREAPLRGRAAEHGLLRSRIAAAASDGRSGVVVLSGAAGTGKTRLLHEARILARGTGARLVSVAGDPDSHVVPHGPLLDAVLAGPRPLVPPAVLADLPRGPEQGYWLRRELQACLQRAALEAPVLVCVDDLQWCDPETLRLIRLLPADLSTDAVVWVVALRRDAAGPGVRATVRALADAGADLVELRPLDDRAVAQIAGDLLGASPDEQVLGSADRAGGEPLLLVELLRGLREEGLVQVHDGTASLIADGIPARLRDAVARRTERLSPTARRLLQVGAVLGRRFPPDLLAAVLDRPPPALLGPVQEVVDAGLLHDDGEQLAFGHDLIRETVAVGMPGGFARTLRRHAVDVLLARGAPTVQVATMLAGSAVPGDPAAVAALREAAATLGPTSSPAAAGFSVRALELLPAGSPDRPEVAAETIMLLWQCGRPAEAEALASTALAGTLGVDAVAEARIRLSLAAFTTRYSPAGAVRQCEAALALPDLPAELRVPLLVVLAENHGLTGEADAADAVLAPALPLLRASPDPSVAAALARTQSYVAFHRDRWDRAFALYGEEGGAADDHAPTGIWPAAMWTAVGHPVRALGILDRWTASARVRGWHGYVLLLTGMLRARVLLDAGRLEDAHAEAVAVLDREDAGLTGGVMDTLVVHALVRTALHTGRTDVLRAQRDHVRRMTLDPTGQVRRNGLWLTALLADAAGDAAAAMAATAEAVATFDRPCPSLAGLPDVTDEVVLTRMALRSGARDVAAHAVRAAERRAAANPAYPVATAAARLARGLLEDDEACVREALRLLEGTERPLVRAAALEDLAVLVAPDRPREAVALLDEALGLFLAAGAEHDGARLRSRLRELGVRRRRAVRPAGPERGMAALTAAEREVVGLVAAGGTNRRVAEQLFLSPHTVNTHLRNAFLKLGVRSRVELTRLVTAPGRSGAGVDDRHGPGRTAWLNPGAGP